MEVVRPVNSDEGAIVDDIKLLLHDCGTSKYMLPTKGMQQGSL